MSKLFLLISFFMTCSSMAQTLEIDFSEKYEVNEHITYTVAKNAEESIHKLSNRTWSKDKNAFNTSEYRNNAYWAKINIKNIATEKRSYYFKAENQFTYKIDYYLVQNKKVIKHIEDGVTSKNHNRAFNTNHMIFPLTLEANSEAKVYFKIRNYNKINIDFNLVTQNYLLDYYQTYNLIEGIFFGGMLLMILYNSFLFVLFRIRAYLYYVAYASWLSIYFLGLFGFSERYFETYNYLFYVSSGAFFIFLTLFVQTMLGLKHKLPKIHKILNLFIAYFTISTIANIYMLEIQLFSYAQLFFNLFFVMLFIFALTIIGSTYYLAFLKKDSIAKFYSIIWSLLALMGLFLPLQYLNIINIEIPADYIFQFLTLVEILFFSFILAHNINLIEEQKKEQEQLLVQQNKLASMGEVIGMIAHQWRQPLSEVNGIILNMDMDKEKKQLSDTKLDTYLDTLEEITAYMSETINDFMNYFKHNKQVETFSLAQLIEGALNLILNTNKSSIPITYVKHPDIQLTSYRSELLQSILIVINNAIDACDGIDKPEILIYITTTNEHIVINIKDNGSGIPPEIMDKIYDPYFTTKHASKGTGLGLYILKMIIEQTLQGKIEISSQAKTTICKIYLPK